MRTARALPSLVLVGAVCVATPAPAEEVNRIVLRVNDKIATLAEYTSRRDARIAAISRASELSTEERRKLAGDAGRSALREIFEELLVLSRAQQLHIEASPAEIDRAVDNARRRFGITSDEEFARGLAESGSSVAEFRGRMAQNLIFNEVLQREIQPRIKIDDEEVARYWREHPELFDVPERRKVEEVVVRETAGTSAERAELANALRELLIEGIPIGEAVEAKGATEKTLVLEHDWIERGALDASLEAVAWELAAGGVAEPVEGRGGLHVLRVLEIRPSSIRPLDEVRQEITNRLQGERYDKESAKYLDELAVKAFVVERIPDDAVGYRTAPAGQHDPVRELMRGTSQAPEQPEAAPESAPASQSRRK